MHLRRGVRVGRWPSPGLDDESIAALRRGDVSRKTPAEKAALEFARKITVNSASVTDDEFAALVKHHGEKSVAAMVLTMAYANFQDRLLLCLGSPMEPGGPLPPLDVAFAPGALAHATAPHDTEDASIKAVVVGDRFLGEGFDRGQPRVDLSELRRIAGEAGSAEEQGHAHSRAELGGSRGAGYRLTSRLATASSGTWSAWVISPSWPLPGRPTCGRLRSKRETRWIGSSHRACSGSRPGHELLLLYGTLRDGLDLAGLTKPEIAQRTRLLAGDDWSSFPAEEQGAYAFARKLTWTPGTISGEDIRGLERDFGRERAIVVLTAACRGHYMTRISNGFQLSLERDNVFREWYFRQLERDGEGIRAGSRPTDPSRDEEAAGGIQT